MLFIWESRISTYLQLVGSRVSDRIIFYYRLDHIIRTLLGSLTGIQFPNGPWVSGIETSP